jgi:REP element-mobilizing transposase RayT
MGRRGYYHLFSDGFRTDVLFEDVKAFVAGMNIVALCYLKCEARILAFVLMDNHVHFILYGEEQECILF